MKYSKIDPKEEKISPAPSLFFTLPLSLSLTRQLQDLSRAFKEKRKAVLNANKLFFEGEGKRLRKYIFARGNSFALSRLALAFQHTKDSNRGSMGGGREKGAFIFLSFSIDASSQLFLKYQFSYRDIN